MMDLQNNMFYCLVLLLLLCCVMLLTACSLLIYMVMKCHVFFTPMSNEQKTLTIALPKQTIDSTMGSHSESDTESQAAKNSPHSIAAPSVVLALVGAHLKSSAGYARCSLFYPPPHR